jgi:hypothetical protein
MPSYLPFVEGFTLGISPEQLNPYFQQFTADGFPAGVNNSGVMSDCAVIMPLTSAQLLALNSTAVQLVAPPTVAGIPSYLIPPTGYLYVPTTMTLQYKYGGTAYTIGGTTPVFQIEYTGKTTSLLSQTPTGLVDQTADTFVTTNLTAGPIISAANSKNLGLEVKLGGTTPSLTLGNGTVTLTLLYNIYLLL